MQVRVGQPLELLFHTRGGFPHGDAAGLQFVWQPGSSLRAFSGEKQALGVS